MKKMISKMMVMTFAIALTSGAIMPKKAEAYILLGGKLIPNARNVGNNTAALFGAVNIFLCVSFLPFCLVDGEASDSSVSSASLLEQGFSAQEIKQIQDDQMIMANNLEAMNGKLVVAEFDTRESIAQDIKTIHPEASEAYTQFMVEMKGL